LVSVRVGMPLLLDAAKSMSAPDGARNCTGGRQDWAMVSIFMWQM